MSAQKCRNPCLRPHSRPQCLRFMRKRALGSRLDCCDPTQNFRSMVLTKRIVALGDLINGYFTSLVSYDIGDVFYSWLNQDSVQVDSKVQIPQFMLMDWRLKFTLHKYATGTDSVFESDPCMSSHTFRD